MDSKTLALETGAHMSASSDLPKTGLLRTGLQLVAQMKMIRFCMVGLTFGLAAAALNAQDTRGQIVGRVIDPAGAVVAGAKVEATNTASNVRTVAKSNNSGDYILPFLIPGEYEVTIEMTGFARFTRKATMEMTATVTVNASLVVGSASETVKVVAEADPLDVSSGSAGYVVDSQSITELPNKDGNVALLSMLSPGVMNTIPSGWSRPFDVSANLSPGVQGVAAGSNQYSLDGAPNMASNYNSYVPPPGVVEELKVQTATFDSSYGFTPGATINMSLKSAPTDCTARPTIFCKTRCSMRIASSPIRRVSREVCSG
jgi:hypothetical protein